MIRKLTIDIIENKAKYSKKFHQIYEIKNIYSYNIMKLKILSHKATSTFLSKVGVKDQCKE